MSSRDSEFGHYVSRPEVEEQISEFIDRREELIHISGEPGVGKTWTLRKVEQTYSGNKEIKILSIGSHFEIDDFYSAIYHSIVDSLPDDKKEERRRLSGLGIGALGFSLSGSLDSESADVPQVQPQPREALKEAAELYHENKHLLLCVDDIHKLSSDEDAIRDAIQWAANQLTENITLITAGRLAFNGLDTAITVSTFSEEQTKSLLQAEFNCLSEDGAEKIYRELDGHPLYIGLLIEANDSDEVPEIPEGRVYDEIQSRYLRSLSEAEQRFLRLTSPLSELNERVCSAVIPSDKSLDSVTIDRLLQGLSDRVITHDLGWNDDGTKSYRIHDTFREFLRKRIDPKEENLIHQSAFRYYSERIRSHLGTKEIDINTEVELVFSCLDHLTSDIGAEEHQELRQLLEFGFSEDGLRYYPASLLTKELKKWNVEELPDDTTNTLINSLECREELARAFYDGETHPSWGEELLLRGRFNEPRGYLLGYLNQITDSQPEFVLRVLQLTGTEDSRTRLFFTSLASELPPDAAAKTTSTVADWILMSEESHDFEFRGLQLVEYLCDHGDPHAALDVLESILHPKPRDTDGQGQYERQFDSYRTTTTLNNTFDQFVSKTGEDFVHVLEDALRTVLQWEEDDTGTVRYEIIANQTPIEKLDYHETNSGKRKHVILTYLCRATDQWISNNVNGATQRQLIHDYLDEENPNFRRLGLFLLSEYPDADIDRVTSELLQEKNYANSDIKFEFYRLLEQGFQYLSQENKERVCQLIRGGPENIDWIMQRAEDIAEESHESVDEIVERKIRQVHRNRLYLIKDDLPKEHLDYLEGILERYGSPGQLPTESLNLNSYGGRVVQKAPDELDEIPTDSAKELLQFLAEWEPSEGEEWEQREAGGFEEVSYQGVRDEFEERIKQHPEEYASKLTILKEIEPQYTDIAIRALRDVLRDNRTFPWNPVLELCEYVESHREEWSDRCRFDIATLLRDAIVSDATDFPVGVEDRTKRILLKLATEGEINPDEQPQSKVGRSLEESRSQAVTTLITFAVWQRNYLDKSDLDREIREIIRSKITTNAELETFWALGRQFGNLWALDKELVKDCLEDFFPTADSPDAKRRFSRAFNGYLTRHGCHAPAYNLIRPYYSHAIDLATEKDLDQQLIDPDALATHVGASYLFQSESLSDDDSLIRQYYAKSSAELVSKVPDQISRALREGDALNGEWEQISELWEWRIDQVEQSAHDHERREKHQREFYHFLECLKNTDEAGFVEERDLVERSARFFIYEPFRIRSLEGWLADQSGEFPEQTIAVYKQFVDSVPSDKWPEIVRSSQSEHRETLYTNAVEYADSERIAIQIANRFAAQGEEYDEQFLDDQFDR
jgi:hypothetical protein